MELSQIYRIAGVKVNARIITISVLGKTLDVDPDDLLKILSPAKSVIFANNL